MRQRRFILRINVVFLVLFSGSTVLADSEVLIPAGKFMMGSYKGTYSEQPVHQVWTDAFYLDRFEVSNKDYEKLIPEAKRSHASSCDDCPVTLINWDEAKAYCENLGKRLPTEAEWEKARRGPENNNGISFAKGARFGLSINAGTAPVQSPAENGYGLHHMEGNVWEWVSDWFDDNYYANSPEKNPKGPKEGYRKVVRGGSWYNDSWYLQAGMRFRLAPDSTLNSLGFRCAKNS